MHIWFLISEMKAYCCIVRDRLFTFYFWHFI